MIRRGIDVRQREETLLRGYTVAHAMHNNAPAFFPDTAFPSIMNHFLRTSLPVCFVVAKDSELLGSISLNDVKSTLQDENLASLVVAMDIARPSRTTVHTNDTMALCLEKFSSEGIDYLPVVSAKQRLIGFISRSDVLDLYNRELLRKEYLGISLQTETRGQSVHERVRLPAEYTVDILEVPNFLIGNTLRQADLRSEYGLTVIAVRRGNFAGENRLPDPEEPFRHKDHLVLVGRASDFSLLLDRTTDQSETGEN
jgi:Trk K+ transport system NAD-binding subunit